MTKKLLTSWMVILIATAISINWLVHTPHGFYEKAFTMGSSVCHQIPSHSFETAGLQFPLCARCSGLYLGSFIGLAYYFTLGKRKALPQKGFILFLFFLFAAWAGDGINSFVTAYLNRSFVYETTNLTRLVTGFGMGLVMSTALMTLFNIAVWEKSKHLPLLFSPWQIIGYIAASAAIGWTLTSQNTTIFWVYAYISITTMLIIVSMLYTIFWTIVFRKEASFINLRSLGLFLVAGFACAMGQITLLNLLRQWVFG